MDIYAGLVRIGQALLDLLYPPHCVCCSRPGAWLCHACQNTIQYLPEPAVSINNDPSSVDWPLDGIYAVAAYQEPLRTAIHEFKYGGVRVLAQPLGELLYTYWQCHGPTADIIVPVPLHAKRLRQRGYNQSDLLAQHLAIKTHIPLRSSLLDRIRYTSPQVELSPEQRHANVKGAFACTADLAGSSILLIDDVCTTGATLRACGQALRAAGAERLYGLVLATPARV